MQWSICLLSLAYMGMFNLNDWLFGIQFEHWSISLLALSATPFSQNRKWNWIRSGETFVILQSTTVWHEANCDEWGAHSRDLSLVWKPKSSATWKLQIAPKAAISWILVDSKGNEWNGLSGSRRVSLPLFHCPGSPDNLWGWFIQSFKTNA